MAKCYVIPLGLNKRLQELRKNAGYSYKELEDLTGISRSSLQRYETNPTADIPHSKIATLAEVYGVSISYVLGLEDKSMPKEYYESLSPLLEEIGCLLHYDCYKKTHTIFIRNKQYPDSCTVPVSNEQIKNLKETTLSYLSFKVNELISSYEPPTTE